MFLETPPGGCLGPYPYHLPCDHEGNLYKTSAGGCFCARCYLEWTRDGLLTTESRLIHARREADRAEAQRGPGVGTIILSFLSLLTLGSGIGQE